MTARSTVWSLLLALLGLVAVGVRAQQSSREAYRFAYRVWREAEPDLERAAGAAADPLEERTRHAAEEAAKFGATRSEFLRQLAESQKETFLPLQGPAAMRVADVSPAASARELVSAEATTVQKVIATFAGDTDPGFQKLRQALEKEQAALAALDDAIAQREKALDKVTSTADVIDQSRSKVFSGYQRMAGAITESAATVDKETAAWAAYYPRLAENARGVTTSSTPAAAPPPPVTPVTPLPLARYTGEWVYPTVNGMFHGAEPDTVDLTVREQSGRATGTFVARFKLPGGSTLDPVVNFAFSGDFAATHNQQFSITSADGASGTLDLIPGNAFNLLEIDFKMNEVPGKITSGYLRLVKK